MRLYQWSIFKGSGGSDYILSEVFDLQGIGWLKAKVFNLKEGINLNQWDGEGVISNKNKTRKNLLDPILASFEISFIFLWFLLFFLGFFRVGFLRNLRDFFGVTFHIEEEDKNADLSLNGEELQTGDQKLILKCSGVGYRNLNRVVLWLPANLKIYRTFWQIEIKNAECRYRLEFYLHDSAVVSNIQMKKDVDSCKWTLIFTGEKLKFC